jgi:cytochrome c oxidase subunit 4
MSEHTHKSHTKEYMLVFLALAVFTVIELIIPELNVSYASKAIGLTLFAFAKAFCVGYFYMHLKEEKRWLKFIGVIPVSAFIYFIVLILESTYR